MEYKLLYMYVNVHNIQAHIHMNNTFFGKSVVGIFEER